MLIGHIYYNSATMNCTNGMISDFYSNFGFMGLLIYPFIVFKCFKVLDNLLYKIEEKLYIPILMILLIPLYQNSVFTWMLTGGYLFTLVILHFFV